MYSIMYVCMYGMRMILTIIIILFRRVCLVRIGFSSAIAIAIAIAVASPGQSEAEAVTGIGVAAVEKCSEVIWSVSAVSAYIHRCWPWILSSTAGWSLRPRAVPAIQRQLGP